MTKKIELLSPAGSIKNMKYAFEYGADAVYCGLPRYSLRVRNNEFTYDKLKQAIQIAHKKNKKLYLVTNILPHNSKVETFIQDLKPLIDLKPDALIMSDPGLIMMVLEKFPQVIIHLSVQANTLNYMTVKFWQKNGIKRIILSRELSIDEIAKIKESCPDMEIEVFVHGALCMAYSGRCLLSGYMNHRDSNQGACTNACRWKYDLHEAEIDSTDNIVAKEILARDLTDENGLINKSKTIDNEEVFLLQEKQRPGEYMPIYQDEKGTYIFNSKDLRAVEHVSALIDIGVDSLKIEGRTKSFYYCARTAQVYSQAINNHYAGKPFDKKLLSMLDSLSNRGYTEGFLRRHIPQNELQNYSTGNSIGSKQQLVGEIINVEDYYYKIVVKNKFLVGDNCELMTPQHNYQIEIKQLYDDKKQPITEALGSGYEVYLKLPFKIKPDYAILLRNLKEGADTRKPY